MKDSRWLWSAAITAERPSNRLSSAQPASGVPVVRVLESTLGVPASEHGKVLRSSIERKLTGLPADPSGKKGYPPVPRSTEPSRFERLSL